MLFEDIVESSVADMLTGLMTVRVVSTIDGCKVFISLAMWWHRSSQSGFFSREGVLLRVENRFSKDKTQDLSLVIVILRRG